MTMNNSVVFNNLTLLFFFIMKALLFINSNDDINIDNMNIDDMNIDDMDGLFCPFCHESNKYLNIYDEPYENNIQSGDYVHPYPMGWLNCCDGRIILNTNTLKYFGTFKDINKKYIVDNKFKDCYFFEIELLYVYKILNDDYCKIYKLYDKLENIKDYYNLSKDDIKIFDNALKVNSFDAMKPNKEYPRYFDTSHDGIGIHLLCIDNKENYILQTYWGD